MENMETKYVVSNLHTAISDDIVRKPDFEETKSKLESELDGINELTDLLDKQIELLDRDTTHRFEDVDENVNTLSESIAELNKVFCEERDRSQLHNQINSCMIGLLWIIFTIYMITSII